MLKGSTLGCPFFVLDSGLQSSLATVPKLDPRARAGIYLDHLPCHTGKVTLMLNPKTPHVLFDDEFSTVPHMWATLEQPFWPELVKLSTENATDK